MLGLPHVYRIGQVLTATSTTIEIPCIPDGYLNKLYLKLRSATDAFVANIYDDDPAKAIYTGTPALLEQRKVCATLTATSGQLQLAGVLYAFATPFPDPLTAERRSRSLFLVLSSYAATPTIDGSVAILGARGVG